MSNDGQKISSERARRIVRIHNWILSVILAVVVPAIVIAIHGYHSFWEFIYLFGFFALAAWTIYWTNSVNSVIFTVGALAVITVKAIMGHRSVNEVIVLFICGGFVVWSHWFCFWVKKRTIEDFGEAKK